MHRAGCLKQGHFFILDEHCIAVSTTGPLPTQHGRNIVYAYPFQYMKLKKLFKCNISEPPSVKLTACALARDDVAAPSE